MEDDYIDMSSAPVHAAAEALTALEKSADWIHPKLVEYLLACRDIAMMAALPLGTDETKFESGGREWPLLSNVAISGTPFKVSNTTAHSVPIIENNLANPLYCEGVVSEKYPNLVLRTLRAMLRGIHFFKTRREDAIKILAKFLGTQDREALVESWEYGDIPAKPYAVETAVQAVINHLAESDAKFAQYKPADFIEAGPLVELDKSGFIDRLYAGQQSKGK